LSLASSPDGKTLYFAAGGKIWSVLSAGGEPSMMRAGDSVVADPAGGSLLISSVENARNRLFRVPLGGGAEREITADSPAALLPNGLFPGSLGADGRLLVSLYLLDSWFFAPAILDTNTGHVTRIPIDQVSNTSSLSWTRDGRILELRERFRSTLWRFQPARK